MTCSLGATGISANAVLMAWFTNSLNQWYLKAVAWILEAQHRWQWDDSNYTDFPVGTGTLVNGQRDYSLPAATSGGNLATFLTLKEVAVKDAAGNYQWLTDIDNTELTGDLETQFSTNGMPMYYKKTANSLKLYPAPATGSVTMSAGLKVEFQRTPDLFTVADTTQQPGIPEPFHRILSLGASYDYLMGRRPDVAGAVRTEVEVLKGQLQTHFTRKDQNARVAIRARQSSFE